MHSISATCKAYMIMTTKNMSHVHLRKMLDNSPNGADFQNPDANCIK